MNLTRQDNPVIESEKIILRRLNDCDLSEIMQLFDHPLTNERAAQLIHRAKAAWNEGSEYIFAVIAKEDMKLKGLIELYEEHENTVMTGYRIMPEHRHKGYASQAVHALVHELMKEDIRTIYAAVQEDNEYSADKGYARVTTLRDCEPVGIGSPRFDDEDRELPARLGYFYNSEAEYILFGHDKESTNNFHAQIMLEVMLVAANYLQARNCYELKAIADSAATAGQAIGIPYSLTKFLILMGFAITETALDMYYLMHGDKIPALSTRGDDMFMMHLADVNSVLNTQGSFMLSYEYYLRLRLMFAMMTDGGRNKLMQRMANLIQLNINYAADEGYGYAHDKDFTMAGAYTSFKATAAGKMPWWFMTSGMMGNARTTSGWRAIPNYTIVANY